MSLEQQPKMTRSKNASPSIVRSGTRYTYHPMGSDGDAFLRTHVQSDRLGDSVVQSLREQLAEHRHIPFLLFGPRGAGKTHLLRYVLLKAEREPRLSRHLIPVVFPEECYDVTDLSDFMVKIVEILTKEHWLPKDQFDLIERTPRAERVRAAERVISNLTVETGRSLLLFIENIDDLFGYQFGDDQGLEHLRSLLQGELDVRTVATALPPADVSNEPFPLFDLFSKRQIRPLSPSELRDLLRKTAFERLRIGESGAAAFLKRFRTNKHRINAVLELTGGNPRLALLLYDVVARNDIRSASQTFGDVLDSATPLFKARIELLSPQERKLVSLLARAGSLSPSEMSEKSGIRAPAVSSILSRLKSRHYVALNERQKKTYVLADSLLGLWLRWREDSAGTSAVAEFLAAWYSKEELEAQLKALRDGDPSCAIEDKHVIELAIRLRTEEDRASCTSWLVGAWVNLLSGNLDAARADLKIAIEDREEGADFLHRLLLLLDLGDAATALQFDELLGCAPGIAGPQLKTLSSQGRWSEFARTFAAHLDAAKDCAETLDLLAHAFNRAGCREDALAIFHRLTQMPGDQVDAYLHIGSLLCEEGEYEAAVHAFDRVVALGGHSVGWAHSQIGYAWERAEQYSKAIDAYSRALELHPEDAHTWNCLGRTNYSIGELDRALECMLKATSLGPNEGWHWYGLGVVQRRRQNFREAISAFKRAVKVEPETAELWLGLGRTYLHDRQLERAAAAVEESVRLDPAASAAWCMLGDIRLAQLDFTGAIDSYQRCFELDPEEHVRAWFWFGVALAQGEKTIEVQSKFTNHPNFFIAVSAYFFLLAKRKLAAKDESAAKRLFLLSIDGAKKVKDATFAVMAPFMSIHECMQRRSLDLARELIEQYDKEDASIRDIFKPFSLVLKYLSGSSENDKEILRRAEPELAKAMSSILDRLDTAHPALALRETAPKRRRKT